MLVNRFVIRMEMSPARDRLLEVDADAIPITTNKETWNMNTHF